MPSTVLTRSTAAGHWSRRFLHATAMAAALTSMVGTSLPAHSQERIQPLNGYWSWDIGASTSSNSCLPGVAESLQQLLPTKRTEQVRFQTPFHPSQLIDHRQVTWEQRTPNHFVATANGVSIQGFPLPMNVQYDLFVESPSKMRGISRVEMNVWQPCTVSSPFEFKKLANPPAPKPTTSAPTNAAKPAASNPAPKTK